MVLPVITSAPSKFGAQGTPVCRKVKNLNFVHARIPLVRPVVRDVITDADVFPEIKNKHFDVHVNGLFSELLHTVETMPCKDKNDQSLGIQNQYNVEQHSEFPENNS